MADTDEYSELFPQGEDPGRPFLVRNLWRPSVFSDLPAESSLFSAPHFATDFSLSDLPARSSSPFRSISTPPPRMKPKLAETSTLFKLPTGFNAPLFDIRSPWPELESESTQTESTDDDGREFSSVAEVDEDMEDMWLSPDAAEPLVKPRVFTWESFLSVPDANDPPNPFISEAGPGTLDAALEEFNEDSAGIVIREDVFCTCLLHLGLGRSSVLFLYDRIKDEFRPVKEKLRVSGCAAQTMERIVQAFAECGMNIRKLQQFSDGVYQRPTSSSPSLIALAHCTTTIIESVQKRLSLSHRSIKSILHLHSLLHQPALVVDCFLQISKAAAGTLNDYELLSKHFEVIQQQQHRIAWLRPLLVETLARVTRPWLHVVEQWVGLNRTATGELIFPDEFIVNAESMTERDDEGKEQQVKAYTFVKERVPSFMSIETAENIFETGRSLRFLETSHPHHPLVTQAIECSGPKLEWNFSWQDLEDLQEQAKKHERSLRAAIQQYSLRRSSSESVAQPGDLESQTSRESFETFGRSKSQIGTHITESAAAMSHDLSPLSSSDDSLGDMVLHLCSADVSSSLTSHLTNFAPPLSVTPLLSFSHILSVQSRLINKACVRMFVKEHHLRTHLSLLRRFHLFGDGVFSSRLADALFSSELSSTERKSGSQRSGGTMGLHLGSRDTWPPASSELRLALMDVLTTSFPDTTTTGIHAAGKNAELPGKLSFAVREMSESELAACSDATSPLALDFLRLDYRPPAPLDAIITPSCMYRYDRIFSLLLRVLRMVYVVTTTLHSTVTRNQSPSRTALKFASEARHFIVTLASYMMNAGITTTWARFERKLSNLPEDTTIATLREYHESTLDRIMFATLCRRRQRPVMAVVDEIFTIVLKFASGEGDDEDVEILYKTFQKKVWVFIAVCRGLSEKRGYGDGRKDLEGRRRVDEVFGTGYKEEANLLSMLLLGIEMGGFYEGR